ncbi:MAG TPA: response regulator transcription factor [Thermoanaerobaculia bacterium]|nr:response regulator transcription factor [Thermoanaerobaculia bacterium]
MRVLVADDHAVVREGLKRILTQDQAIQVVAEAEDGAAALARASEMDLDVVVLDMSMPGRGGLETLQELKRLWPRLGVLVLSMHPEDQYAVRVLREGADGYLSKESAAEELITALRKIHGGGKYVSPTLAERLAMTVERGFEGPPHDRLSTREFQVMVLLAEGKTVTQIGVELHLSVKTISTYRARIMEKMGMKNNAELMHYAIEEGIVC